MTAVHKILKEATRDSALCVEDVILEQRLAASRGCNCETQLRDGRSRRRDAADRRARDINQKRNSWKEAQILYLHRKRIPNRSVTDRCSCSRLANDLYRLV